MSIGGWQVTVTGVGSARNILESWGQVGDRAKLLCEQGQAVRKRDLPTSWGSPWVLHTEILPVQSKSQQFGQQVLKMGALVMGDVQLENGL